MIGTLQMPFAFAFCLAAAAALAQEPPAASVAPTMPKPIKVIRFVPAGEEWSVGTLASLYPDCSSRGRIVARVTDKPRHGEVTSTDGDVFPNMASNSPLAVCNSKRSPGLTIRYRSEADFVGEDSMKVFLIIPDGSAAEWDYELIVKLSCARLARW